MKKLILLLLLLGGLLSCEKDDFQRSIELDSPNKSASTFVYLINDSEIGQAINKQVHKNPGITENELMAKLQRH